MKISTLQSALFPLQRQRWNDSQPVPSRLPEAQSRRRPRLAARLRVPRPGRTVQATVTLAFRDLSRIQEELFEIGFMVYTCWGNALSVSPNLSLPFLHRHQTKGAALQCDATSGREETDENGRAHASRTASAAAPGPPTASATSTSSAQHDGSRSRPFREWNS